MSESELAFNVHGEPFTVPEGVTGWRVRRLKGTRGQPELVYGPDGPITLEVNATIEDLRDAVGAAGRYRLDPIDDDAKLVSNAPIAYVQVVLPEKPEPAPEREVMSAITMTSVDLALREMSRAATELARTNSELARNIVSKQPDVMLATAEILRAADGAGLPSRMPSADSGDDTDDDETTAGDAKRLDLVSILEKVIPMVLPAVMEKIPGLGELLDPRKAAAAGAAEREKKRTAQATPHAEHSQVATANAPTIPPEHVVEPKAERSALAHMMAIQAALDPAEADFAQAAAASMSASERSAWFAELTAVSVSDAVARIRSEIQKTKGVVS